MYNVCQKIEESNKAVDEKYIVDRETKLLEEEMERYYFAERKTSAKLIGYLRKSLDIEDRTEAMIDLQIKYLPLLNQLVLKEEQIRNVDQNTIWIDAMQSV